MQHPCQDSLVSKNNLTSLFEVLEYGQEELKRAYGLHQTIRTNNATNSRNNEVSTLPTTIVTPYPEIKRISALESVLDVLDADIDGQFDVEELIHDHLSTKEGVVLLEDDEFLILDADPWYKTDYPYYDEDYPVELKRYKFEDSVKEEARHNDMLKYSTLSNNRERQLQYEIRALGL